ncbi:MAG: galactokinase [Verrucomicrobiota bacterium]
MIQVYAPGRAEILGNHTDYNEGLVLSIAVDRGTTVRGNLRYDGKIRLIASDLSEEVTIDLSEVRPQEEKKWANYVLGVYDQFIKRGLPSKGFDLQISSNLPMGAGLSSSAALEVATGLFLQQIYKTDFDRLELAKIGQAAENLFSGVQCGLLDQISSLFGKKDHLILSDFRTFEVRNIPIPSGFQFVIANSKVKHALVDGEYNERRESCEAAAKVLGVKALRDLTPDSLEKNAKKLTPRALQRARHVVGEIDRVEKAVQALIKQDVAAFGKLMWASHESSVQNFENSCKELDLLVAAAQKVKGCGGGRLSGGGFGGATINLVENSAVEGFTKKVSQAWKGTECLVTSASEGAHVF